MYFRTGKDTYHIQKFYFQYYVGLICCNCYLDEVLVYISFYFYYSSKINILFLEKLRKVLEN